MTCSKWLLCLLLTSLGSLSASGSCTASDATEPYRIQIVLSVARHPLLTEVFRQQAARELSDGLQAALGDLAKVEAADHHPKLDDVRRFGLVKGLDGWRERSVYKTHFVQIDYTGGVYTVATRQLDGLLGLPSPVVRRDRTRDRAYVARTAALLIERDLGLLGMVESEPDAKRLVRVALKAGNLGADLSKWVKKGEVFALYTAPSGAVSALVPWVVLQVEEDARDGACVCRIHSRYRLRVDGGTLAVAGLRCVLLGTHKGTLRLRLVQDTPGKGQTRLSATVTLEIRHHGFEGEDATKLRLTSSGVKDVDTAGRSSSGKGVFNRLAFVSVLSNDTLRARIPVPLVDDGLVVLPVPAGDEAGSLIAFRFRALQRNVLDSYQVQTDLFDEINKRTSKPEQRAEALATVRKTLERCREDHQRLTAERAEIGKEIAKLSAADNASLPVIDSRLAMIKSGEIDLNKHVAILEKIEKEENDPKRKEWKIQKARAELLVKEGELGEAIRICESAPAEFQSAELAKYVADLKKQWEPRDDKHRDARDFIYKKWPALVTADLKAGIKDATDALEACKRAADVLGPMKLRKGTEKHVQRLAKELEALKPDVNIDDQKPAKLIAELVEELRKLDESTEEYLRKHKK